MKNVIAKVPTKDSGSSQSGLITNKWWYILLIPLIVVATALFIYMCIVAYRVVIELRREVSTPLSRH